MVAFKLPANSRVRSGKTWPASAACSRLKQFRVYRWNPDAGGNPVQDVFSVDLDQCGPMVLDALIKIKNEIELDADFPPLLPRGCLRLLSHEHRRRQSSGLHDADCSHQGRRPHLSAEPRAGDQGSGRRSEPSLCPVPADQTVVADGHACAAGRRTACSRSRSGHKSTATGNASYAFAAPPHARVGGGRVIATWGPPSCCRPIAGSWTVAMKPPSRGSTSCMTRSVCIAVTRS